MTVKNQPIVWRPERCTCGHTIGDHRSSGTRSLSWAALENKYGICLIDGCGCRKFVKTPEKDGGPMNLWGVRKIGGGPLGGGINLRVDNEGRLVIAGSSHLERRDVEQLRDLLNEALGEAR